MMLNNSIATKLQLALRAKQSADDYVVGVCSVAVAVRSLTCHRVCTADTTAVSPQGRHSTKK
jgi:hypothetical protein